jgi:regulator of nucleoside diphosphate kinase
MGFPAIRSIANSFMRRWYKRIIQSTEKDQRILAEMDYFRLHALLTAEGKERCNPRRKNRKKLRQILKQGCLFPFKLVPSSVVTMNSTVRLRTQRGTPVDVVLVYPKDEDRKKKGISVLSLLGLSILGKRAGDVVLRNVVVEKIVFQPEISNKFTL